MAYFDALDPSEVSDDAWSPVPGSYDCYTNRHDDPFLALLYPTADPFAWQSRCCVLPGDL